MGIGQELLNVPIGGVIRQIAFAIAAGQTKLDENSINTAEMMGGLTTETGGSGDLFARMQANRLSALRRRQAAQMQDRRDERRDSDA